MITAAPHALDVQRDAIAIIRREDYSDFWKKHKDVFPSASQSAFWTRDRHFSQLVETARKAKSFSAGWDGYDAPTPNDTAVGATIEILSQIQSSSKLDPYSVLPSADGGVGISFRGGNNKRVVLELLNDGSALCVMYGRGQQMQSAGFTPDTEFPRILQRLGEYL